MPTIQTIERKVKTLAENGLGPEEVINRLTDDGLSATIIHDDVFPLGVRITAGKSRITVFISRWQPEKAGPP